MSHGARSRAARFFALAALGGRDAALILTFIALFVEIRSVRVPITTSRSQRSVPISVHTMGRLSYQYEYPRRQGVLVVSYTPVSEIIQAEIELCGLSRTSRHRDMQSRRAKLCHATVASCCYMTQARQLFWSSTWELGRGT